MWRSICALIAAAWFFAGLALTLNPLVGFGFLALAVVNPDEILDLLFDERPVITLPRDRKPPADD